MGYLSCRADSSISTCRSIAAVSPSQKKEHHHQQQQQHQRRPKQESIAGEEDVDDDDESEKWRQQIQHFTYAELESATNNFSDSSLLGRGSHGSVYKATLRHHHRRHLVVAVKRPSPRPPPLALSSEVENEIKILSCIRSPCLVNLIGFTPIPSSKLRLLVVEFMPNGTLYDLLHTNPNPPSFSRRIRIALQVAKALLTLHSASPPIIHRDVKSANILIDRNFNARLGDFGLALRLNGNDNGNGDGGDATPPAGTLGYLDPAYVTPDNLSTKTDVFSFGILLLEILSGRKAIDVAHSPPSVVEWAVPLLRKGKVGAIYDTRTLAPKDSKVRRGMAVLAASCVRSSDERRPGMEEVVEQLKLMSKTMNAAKAWNGPCAVVDTEKTLSKKNTSTNMKMVNSIKEDRKGEEKIAEDGMKEEPLGPLRNGRKVLTDLEGKRGSRNLMELLARPDGEIIELCGGESSVISRARTLRLPSESCNRVGTVVLRRNQTLKKTQFVSLAISDGVQNSDGRPLG